MSIIPEPDYIGGIARVDDLGRIHIPKEMRKKLKIEQGDVLQITATENLIIIEKCEGEEE